MAMESNRTAKPSVDRDETSEHRRAWETPRVVTMSAWLTEVRAATGSENPASKS